MVHAGNNLDPLLSIGEVLAVVGVSRSSVYAMIQRGAFPPGVKVGRARRWRRSEIATWLDTLGEGGPDAW